MKFGQVNGARSAARREEYLVTWPGANVRGGCTDGLPGIITAELAGILCDLLHGFKVRLHNGRWTVPSPIIPSRAKFDRMGSS